MWISYRPCVSVGVAPVGADRQPDGADRYGVVGPSVKGRQPVEYGSLTPGPVVARGPGPRAQARGRCSLGP